MPSLTSDTVLDRDLDLELRTPWRTLALCSELLSLSSDEDECREDSVCFSSTCFPDAAVMCLSTCCLSVVRWGVADRTSPLCESC